MGLIRLLVRNKLFILLIVFIYIFFWFIIENKINRSISNFNFILEYLSKFNINLLLIDPFLLDYLFIRQLSFEKYYKRLITFGIFNNSIQIIHPLFSIKNFSIKISENFNQTSIDHIFIEYNQQIIHLAILHEENSYFLIRKNIVKLPNDIKLSYGDTLRVIEPIETELIKDKFSFSFPRNISHFLWLYNTSEFLQCWYRHCGLIPYTQDVDFGLFAEEYDENIRNYFLGNSLAYLWGALGLVNDSLEFRLFTGQYTFDLFWAYREDNHRWYGYQLHRLKYRRILPLLPTLCSCDLFGYRFSIPCSPIDYLNNEYGYETWKNPLEKNYTWINIKYHSIWDDISWMYAIRLYTPEGKLRTDKYAIDWIVNQFNYSLKTIPSFRNILPNKSVTLPPIKN